MRNHDGGREILSLGYQAHPEGQVILSECCAAVSSQTGLLLAAAHRVGRLVVADVAPVRGSRCSPTARGVALPGTLALNGLMASRSGTTYSVMSSLSRINLLHVLQQHGSKTVTELAEATGLHHNTAREHLHRLIGVGLVTSESIRRTTKGRPRILYRAAIGDDDPTRAVRARAAEDRTAQFRKLAPRPDDDLSPMDRQVEMLDDHMDQCRIVATIETDSLCMTMHSCPFSELAKNHPQVCEVHYALVKDAIKLAPGPLHVDGIHPFSGPNNCTIHLGSGEAAVE